MTGVQWTRTVRDELTLTRSPITPRGAVSCVRASTLVLDVQPTDVHVSTRNAWALHVSRPDRLTLQASGESWMTMPLWYRRYSTISPAAHDRHTPQARFTKYLTTILRLSYDNAKVTIDLRRSSNLRNILRRTQGFSYVQFTCKIVRSSKIVCVN